MATEAPSGTNRWMACAIVTTLPPTTVKVTGRRGCALYWHDARERPPARVHVHAGLRDRCLAQDRHIVELRHGIARDGAGRGRGRSWNGAGRNRAPEHLRGRMRAVRIPEARPAGPRRPAGPGSNRTEQQRPV